MLEYERKVLLSAEEYAVLSRMADSAAVQTNYYYDTDRFDMNRLGITCRIREKNGNYTATVKQHSPTGGYSMETERDVCGLTDWSFFQNPDVKLQGQLTTMRHILNCSKGIEVVLDKNMYLGYTDYELEIEYAPDAESQAMDLLRRYAAVLYKNDRNAALFCRRADYARNKSARFFERLAWILEQKGDG